MIVSADGEPGPKLVVVFRIKLVQREIENWVLRLANSGLPHIWRNADNLDRSISGQHVFYVLSNWIFSRPELTRHFLIHDCDVRRALTILIRKIPSAHNGRAHNIEETRRDS